MTPRRASVALLLLVTGCVAKPPATADDALARIERHPQAFVEHVAELRQLDNSHPARILFENEADFLRALEAHGKQDVASNGSDRGALYLAFGLGPQSAGQGSSADAVVKEQVVAFYDETTHVIHVRRHPPAQGKDPLEPSWVLAHEVGHSLQYQNFRMPLLERIRQEDRLLAVNALVEGDAMLTMLAYVADERHVPLRRALVQASRHADQTRVEHYAEHSGAAPVLLDAPSIVRKRLMFPYLSGTRFVGALYRAGGLSLVDRAFSHLPATTEQVLHPEKYLAGEPAVPVRAPAAPPGYKTVASGRLGELQTGVVLGECVPGKQAREAAAGWGGDAFTVSKSPAGSYLMAWSSVWDSEADAAQFQRAASALAQCAPASRDLPAQYSVRRSGDRVAFVRGALDPRALDAEMLTLLSLPGARPAPSPPFGAVTIPPIARAPRVHPPYLSRGSYVNERLGVQAAVPPGYGARLDKGGLLLQSPGSDAFASIDLADWVVDAKTTNLMFSEIARSVAKAMHGHALVYVSGGAAQTPLGPAAERDWNVEGTTARLRILILPVCNQTGAIVLTQVYAGEESHQMLDWWLGTLRPLYRGPPPVCAELEP